MELTQEVRSLSTLLLAEMAKGMDARDTALCEKIGRIIEEKQVALREEILTKSRQFAPHGLDPNGKEVREFSLSRLIAARVMGNPRIAGLEIEMCREAAATVGRDMSGGLGEAYGQVNRDMAASVDTQIGFIVPMQVFTSRIIPLLQAKVTIFNLGCTQYTGLTGGTAWFPKIAGPTTAVHVNHDTITSPTAVTGSDMTTGNVELNPKTVAAKSIISMRLASLTSGQAERAVEGQLSKDIGLMVDKMGYQGLGVNGEPRGVLNVNGINSVTSFGAASASTAYDKIIDMIHALAEDEALEGNLGFAMHPNIFREFRKMKDPSDSTQPKERRLLDAAPFSTLMGYKFAVTTNFPTNDLGFGNWADLYYGQWGTLQLFIDSLTVNGKLQIQILGAMDYDWQVGHAVSFCNTASMTGG